MGRLLSVELYKTPANKRAFINGLVIMLSYVKSLILKEKVKLLILKENWNRPLSQNEIKGDLFWG